MIGATYSFFKPFFPISIYSQPLKINQLTINLQKIRSSAIKKTHSCVAIAVVSNARFLGYSSATSANNSEPRRNNGDERRKTLQCGAQDLDTSSYQVSDLEDIEFNWENSQLDMDAVFRPRIDTLFLKLRLTIYRWKDQLKTPFCWTKRKTRRMLLHLHQCPSLSDPRNLPGCREVALLEQE